MMFSSGFLINGIIVGKVKMIRDRLKLFMVIKRKIEGK